MHPLHLKIAKTILNRTNSLATAVMQGEMRASLGEAAYGEALNLGWLAPDPESGELHVTTRIDDLNTMRHIIEMEGKESPKKVGDKVIVTDQGQTYEGVVQSVDEQGQVHVSFGAKKPPVQRPYKSEETRVIVPSTPSSGPGSPIPFRQASGFRPAPTYTGVE